AAKLYARPTAGASSAEAPVGRRAVVAALELGVADPVGADRSVMEQGRALGGRITLGKPFERVEQDVVRKRHLIRREVAFEHASLGAARLNAVGRKRSHRGGQFFRPDRLLPGLPIE